MVTIGNVLHLVIVVVALVAFVVLGVAKVITGDACVAGIAGLVAGAAPAGVGVAAKVEKSNGNGTAAQVKLNMASIDDLKARLAELEAAK